MAAGAVLSIVAAAAADERPDPHSFSRPDQVRVTHLDWRMEVRFPERRLQGWAMWRIERPGGAPADAPLVLDTRGLTIHGVRAASAPGVAPQAVPYRLGEADPLLGSPLSIDLPADATVVVITYDTAPDASALQWVAPEGTAGKTHPFLYSQCQAIHARSLLPCQDTPSVRFTYEATLVAPAELKAVMAADGPRPASLPDGAGPRDRLAAHRFVMDQSIPSYLLALAVGDLRFRTLGDRTGVWAEPATLDLAASEFADVEAMLAAAESRFGPYRWGRYDILVLPPSFPYGGMENPRLTFATPTVLAGDRSQVALIAHELSHSWSGNLVTNATWADFWLNEGFTVYLERRIVADVFGEARAAMESVLGRDELNEALAKLPPRDQILNPDLKGRDPDDSVTPIAYEKGALFLETLAAKLGRDRVQAFLKGYFDHFAFQSITTAQFEDYLRKDLFRGEPPPVDLHAWIHEPGLPPDAAAPASPIFAHISRLAHYWRRGQLQPAELEADRDRWSTLEWLHFLRSLPSDLSAERMAALDAAFHLTDTGNAEIACQWLEMAIHAGYRPADGRLERFLQSVGRRKFLMPLYEALLEVDGGPERAERIFERARAGYHPIAVESVRRLLETRAPRR
jgi:aminopeptidase N